MPRKNKKHPWILPRKSLPPDPNDYSLLTDLDMLSVQTDADITNIYTQICITIEGEDMYD